MNYEIELDQVTLKYGRAKALDNITLKLDYGKIYGLLGRNGAGKTSLLSLIASFMEPTSGEVRIGGRKAFEDEEIMPLVGFIYVADYKEESDTVKGMLDSAERYRSLFDREYADYLTDRFQLPTTKKMKDLSKGQQSAVNVTIGLAGRMPITIFDEAYLGMDAPSREIFYKELLEDHERHPRTIILSTHHVSEVDYLFEDAIILHKGKTLLYEPIDILLERGASVTGAKQNVDSFVNGMKILHTEQLGGTKQAMVYGKIPAVKLHEAEKLGLEIGSVSLQQLFIHLTEGGRE